MAAEKALMKTIGCNLDARPVLKWLTESGLFGYLDPQLSANSNNTNPSSTNKLARFLVCLRVRGNGGVTYESIFDRPAAAVGSVV